MDIGKLKSGRCGEREALRVGIPSAEFGIEETLSRVGKLLASRIQGDLPSPKRSRLREAPASAGLGRSRRQAEVAPTHQWNPFFKSLPTGPGPDRGRGRQAEQAQAFRPSPQLALNF